MGTIPKYCKDCRNLHTGGRKETKYARWCCKHSRDTQKIWKHCKENGGKVGAGGHDTVACDGQRLTLGN